MVIPEVIVATTDEPPVTPPDMKAVCLAKPDTLDFVRCPLVKWGGYTYWALAYLDNRIAFHIVAYGPTGRVAKMFSKAGARYLWKITTDDTNQWVTFHGQDSQSVTVTWDELRVDQR